MRALLGVPLLEYYIFEVTVVVSVGAEPQPSVNDLTLG